MTCESVNALIYAITFAALSFGICSLTLMFWMMMRIVNEVKGYK